MRFFIPKIPLRIVVDLESFGAGNDIVSTDIAVEELRVDVSSPDMAWESSPSQAENSRFPLYFP